MDQVNDTQPTHVERPSGLSEAITDARHMAREQITAAWQMHLDRIREQIDTGWRESLDRVFEERFGEVEHRLKEGYETAVGERTRQEAERLITPSRSAARRETLEQLNNLARRLRQAESRQDAVRTLLDSAGQLCRRAELILTDDTPPEPSSALANAIESRDTVVALGPSDDSRLYLIPLIGREKVVGILQAEAGVEPVEVNALELMASLAVPHIEPAPPPPAAPAVTPPKPTWSDLSRPDQEVHLRAQRFARTRVAELLLHHISRVREARAARNIYAVLREDIDAARDQFRQEFFAQSPTMVDYYHLELVRTLAKDDADALGSDYPGPLA